MTNRQLVRHRVTTGNDPDLRAIGCENDALSLEHRAAVAMITATGELATRVDDTMGRNRR
jgi:hypothetical protein